MWEKRPILFLILATVVIMIGTTVTMIVPFLSVNTEADRIASVKPYTPLQQEGRDIYIREGCNNCHTQTVRPLVSEVLRYGEYSKSGEFVYDRPFLWGSKRTGPDLARLGGKYPDSWHYKHLESPRAMITGSNMPDYGWLKANPLDPQMIERKMKVLHFPYSAAQLSDLADKNEMDALVAYLQKLGSDIPWRKAAQATIVGELKNPYAGASHEQIEPWEKMFENTCAPCHGEHREGGIGPSLIHTKKTEAELFNIIYNGIETGGMPSFGSMGSDKVWQMVNFVKHYEDD
ncbi:cbb3-type cytochrome c oxidase subunit II [Geopsychrobacter electrodiphilus]|uniref:cbb3-type cytochrome c oxidase subunit II n=1 Tax=Geopsychrobacter electrodiphilus TaxID=225196 RepID=UPI00037CF852|nr:cbb3-type cytochrome c oxidase subunit II [Geopsychrobacter electrodiphilus]